MPSGAGLAGSAKLPGRAWAGMHLLERRAEKGKRSWENSRSSYLHPLQGFSRSEAPHTGLFEPSFLTWFSPMSGRRLWEQRCRAGRLIEGGQERAPGASWSRAGSASGGNKAGMQCTSRTPGSWDCRVSECSSQEGGTPASLSWAEHCLQALGLR